MSIRGRNIQRIIDAMPVDVWRDAKRIADLSGLSVATIHRYMRAWLASGDVEMRVSSNRHSPREYKLARWPKEGEQVKRTKIPLINPYGGRGTKTIMGCATLLSDAAMVIKLLVTTTPSVRTERSAQVLLV